MASIYALLLLLATIWIPALLAVKLRRDRGSRGWWVALAVCFIGGAIAAQPLVQLQYAASEELQVVGFPIPYLFFHIEHGCWVDYLVPGLAFVGVSNTMVLASVCVVPLMVVRVIVARRQRQSRA